MPLPTIVFDPALDPTEAIEHRQVWATDIIGTRDRHEQRRSLRRLPRQYLGFGVITVDAAEMARLDALLQAGAPDGFKVPMWCDRLPLTSSLTAGSTTMGFTTAGYSYVATEQVMFYLSSRSYELVTLSAVAGGSITFSATVNTWPIGTLLVPIKTGYLVGPVSPSRTFRDGQSSTVSFILR